MGISHKQYDVRGVQFHLIGHDINGMDIMKNWLKI
jgi:hypothetical protein